MLKILQAKFQQYVDLELPDVKAGFRKGRVTRDQIAGLLGEVFVCRFPETAKGYSNDFGAQKNKVSHCFPIYLP